MATTRETLMAEAEKLAGEALALRHRSKAAWDFGSYDLSERLDAEAEAAEARCHDLYTRATRPA